MIPLPTKAFCFLLLLPFLYSFNYSPGLNAVSETLENVKYNPKDYAEFSDFKVEVENSELVSLTIIEFPDNAISLKVGNSFYVNSNFPTSGVQVPVLSTGQTAEPVKFGLDATMETLVSVKFRYTDSLNQSGIVGNLIIEFVPNPPFPPEELLEPLEMNNGKVDVTDRLVQKKSKYQNFITLTSFPENTQEISVNGVGHTEDEFPKEGIKTEIIEELLIEYKLEATTKVLPISFDLEDDQKNVGTYQTVLAISSPLPLELIFFDAKRVNDNVTLAWKTANASNVSHFDIQKSIDLKEVVNVRTIKFNSATNYTAILPSFNLSKATQYYRLKIVDLDGSFEYSSWVSIENKSNTAIIYPNPVPGKEFRVLLEEPVVSCKLFTSKGSQVELMQNGSLFKVTQSPAHGVYYIHINEEQPQRVIFR